PSSLLCPEMTTAAREFSIHWLTRRSSRRAFAALTSRVGITRPRLSSTLFAGRTRHFYEPFPGFRNLRPRLSTSRRAPREPPSCARNPPVLRLPGAFFPPKLSPTRLLSSPMSYPLNLSHGPTRGSLAGLGTDGKGSELEMSQGLPHRSMVLGKPILGLIGSKNGLFVGRVATTGD